MKHYAFNTSIYFVTLKRNNEIALLFIHAWQEIHQETIYLRPDKISLKLSDYDTNR